MEVKGKIASFSVASNKVFNMKSLGEKVSYMKGVCEQPYHSELWARITMLLLFV